MPYSTESYPFMPNRTLLASGLFTLLSTWWLSRKLDEALKERDFKQEQHYRQTEALFSLFAQIPFRAPLPTMRAWAISPDFANLIVSEIRAQKPNTILELGSGISTIISGYCIERQGFGRIIAVDHDEEFAEQSRANIKEHGLENVVEIIYAPLKPLLLEGREWMWYDTSAFDAVHDIDLLTVDGPPQMYNPTRRVRYPALPYLLPKLSENAYILMDDADREDEKSIAEMWLRDYPVTLVRRWETERGTLLLKRKI
jgi:predicted O-methyltransferase YrrM